MEPEVVAVGECGLDFHYDHSPRDQQAEVFAAQIAMALAHDLALVIHTREAWPETFDILAAEGVPARTVFHCFTGGPDEARRCLDLGAVLSFSGIVSFPVRHRPPRRRPAVPARPAAGGDRQPLPGAGAAPGQEEPAGLGGRRGGGPGGREGRRAGGCCERDMGHGQCHVRPAGWVIREHSVHQITSVLFAFVLRTCVTSSGCSGEGQVRREPRPATWRMARHASSPHPSPPLRPPPAGARADRAAHAAPPPNGRPVVQTAAAVVDLPLDGDVVEVPALARVHRSRLALALGVTLAAMPVIVLDNLPATAEANEARVESSSSRR